MAVATTLRTPLGRRVKVIEHGTGTPVVFLHSGVGSAGEWKQVFSLWPEGYRLVAIEAYRDSTGPGVAGCRSLDDFADQVYAVSCSPRCARTVDAVRGAPKVSDQDFRHDRGSACARIV